MANLREQATDLLTQAADALARTAGLDARIVKHYPPEARKRRDLPDAELQLEIDGKRHRLLVEIIRADRFAALGAIKAQLDKFDKPALFVAPYVTPEIAARCRAMGLQFMDTVGNAYLNAPGLRVFVAGQRRADVQQTLGTTRATNATGLRIVFALLCKPELLNAPYREINEAAGVALGAVGWVFNDLTARGLVIGDKRKGGRRFTDLKRLFTEWVTNYPLKLRPKLGPRRYHATDPQRWQQADIEKYRAYWGGEAAADRLTRFLKPEHATIYTRADPAELVVNFRLRPDPGGEIEILQAFWHPALDAETAATVPPVLVYADLMATLDPRNHDAAQMIYERYLASSIDQAG